MANYPSSKSPERVQLAQGKVPACKRDGFPMLRIGGRLECVVEYLDRCIGQQKIVDMIERQGTTYLVFANGHKLPLLCGCCNGALEFDDLESMRRDILQWHLEYMSMARTTINDGREFDELILGFSRKDLFSKEFELSVAFEVAIKLEHPVQCRYKSRSNSNHGRKKKRHSRKKRRKR